MKVTVYNTGFDADGIAAGARAVMEVSKAQALVEKWGGMMKMEPYEDQAPEPTLPEALRIRPTGPKRRGRPPKPKVAAKPLRRRK